MNKKLILTSILAIGVTGAAHAITEESTFSEYMQEDTRYLNAANETNVGVDGGNVTANANYDWNMVTVPAGKYLPANTDGLSANLANCTEGNFCPGLNEQVHYLSTTQGLTSCATLGDTTYIYSAAGASLETQCYRTCNANNMGNNGSIAAIPHATVLTGNDYYGNGEDTCEPTQCEQGYHVANAAPAAARAIVAGDLFGMTYMSLANDGQKDGSAAQDLPNYGLTLGDRNSFGVDYSQHGLFYGHGRCSTTTGTNNSNAWTNPTKFDVLENETGFIGANYCYCRLEGFTPSGSVQRQNFVTPWMFMETMTDEEDCADRCSEYCGMFMGDGEIWSQAYTTAMLNSLPKLALCDVNTYNITWGDTLTADVWANNAETAIFGGSINTPVQINPSAVPAGKRFVGWTFEQPQQSQP